MRVIESLGFYFPDSTGGTEVFVDGLVKRLRASGLDCLVAAPASSEEPFAYDHGGAKVFRYPVPNRMGRRAIRGVAPPPKFRVFRDWLARAEAAVYHQHSWTTGCGLWHLKAAKEQGLATVLTVHVPGNICLRGTMMLDGRSACDGEVRDRRCAACWLQSKGVPETAARTMGALPAVLVAPMLEVPRVGPMFGAAALAARRRSDIAEMIDAADVIVAVCGWLHQALRLNGVPAEKLRLVRYGVGETAKLMPPSTVREEGTPLKLGFLGRADPVKGVSILIEAMRGLPTGADVLLDVRAIGTGPAADYRSVLIEQAHADRRISFGAPVAREDLSTYLATIDVLMVPSQWLETGPLVVLEAHAAGVPVVGSAQGGIAELVQHGENGLLVPHADAEAWAAAIARLALDRPFLDRLREGIRPVRRMDDVADAMIGLYSDVLNGRARPSSPG